MLAALSKVSMARLYGWQALSTLTYDKGACFLSVRFDYKLAVWIHML